MSLYQFYHPARGWVGRVTDCGVRGLGFKSPCSILTSRTETSSLSRVVRDGWDPCFVPVSGEKKSQAVESSTWPLNSHNCSENNPKTKTWFSSDSTLSLEIFIYIGLIISQLGHRWGWCSLSTRTSAISSWCWCSRSTKTSAISGWCWCSRSARKSAISG